MTVEEFAGRLASKVLTGKIGLDRKVEGVYVCDLLSWVISHSNKGDAWITVHTNLNIVAVAVLAEISCIIIPENIEVEKDTIQKAVEEGIPILSSKLSAYEICCSAYRVLDGGQ